MTGFYFVGRIFDLPLRSKGEELQFCYGTNSSEDENEENGHNDKQKTSNKIKNRVSNKKNVKFDWIPPNVSDTLVRKCFSVLLIKTLEPFINDVVPRVGVMTPTNPIT